MITFQPLTREDFPLLARWLAEPLVARWWNHETSPEAVERDFGPSIDGADVTELFLVAFAGRPIGLVQRYPIAAYPEYVDEFASICPLPGVRERPKVGHVCTRAGARPATEGSARVHASTPSGQPDDPADLASCSVPEPALSARALCSTAGRDLSGVSILRVRWPRRALPELSSVARRVGRRVALVAELRRWALHRELRAYKDDRSEVVRDHCTLGLAAVLARFLAEHEACLTRAAQSTGFRLVTTVPSRELRADESRARLREIVGRRCPGTAGRFTRVLRAAGADGPSHRYTPARYRATVALEGLDVLLVDDTWTTGASAQAAARALKAAGAHRVALVVIGRHVNPAWADHALRIRGLSAFSWSSCARHAGV